MQLLQYSDNVKQIDFEFDQKSSIKCNATGGDVVDFMNDDYFKLKKKVALLERAKQ